jgi:hypothetical protein
MGENLLNDLRFGLDLSVRSWIELALTLLTWMLAVQSEVMLVILEPDTPGGLRLSMDCRMPSRSATAEVMVRGSYSTLWHSVENTWRCYVSVLAVFQGLLSRFFVLRS